MNSILQRVGSVMRLMMNKRSLTILSIVVVLIGLPLTVYLNQQRQDIRQQASDGPTCTQGEFTDLSVADQPAVHCLSTNPYCVVQGTSAAAGGTQFQGSRNVLRSEAIAFIARYHVTVIGDWVWRTSDPQAFRDVPPSMDLYREIQTAKAYGFIQGADNGDGTRNFDPNAEWRYGMTGVEKSEYNFQVLQPPITRSAFVQQLYAYGVNRKFQLPLCTPKTYTRCSKTNGCTKVTFQSVDGGTHPLPNTTTSVVDPSCGPISGGNNSACPLPTSTPRPVAPTATPIPAPKTYMISGVVSGGPASVTVNRRTSAGAAPTTTQTDASGNYAFRNLSAGYYMISISPPSGYTQTSATVTYGITLGASPCTIIQVGNTASCGTDGSASKVNFTLAQAAQKIGTMTVAPATGSYTAGQTFTVTLGLSGATYNASEVPTGESPFKSASATVTISPNLQVVSVTPNNCGTIQTGGTVQNPSFSWSTASNVLNCTLYTMSVKAVSAGTGTITLSNAQMTSSRDNSNILNPTGGLKNASYTIAAVPVSQAPAPACNTSCTTSAQCSGAISGCTACIAGKCVPPVAATATTAPNHTMLAVSFRQHGIGLPADNANPNPTITASSVIPTPVQPFQSRPVTVYLSTGTTANDGIPVYEHTKNGTVTFTSGNALYGYTGTIDLGTDISAGQYIVAIRTSNSLSQQSTGFVTITPGQTITTSFPALISGNVYDSSIDNTTPVSENQLDVLDYNAIMDHWLTPELCDGKTGTELQACQTVRSRADLNADGSVDVLDYNLFIRELSVQRGR